MKIQKVTPVEYRCKGWFCRAWNHWLNPLGNYHEPNPYPEKRRVQAEASRLPAWLWWALRNPFHNLNHFMLGITPRAKRYEWVLPDEDGWTRYEDGKGYAYWYRPGHRKLGIRKGNLWGREWYIGWMSRGNFGVAFRK
jgi:hypothetical protein